MLGDTIFQVMGLVHDQVAVIRQHAIFDGYVGQQQGVVDDNEVGTLSRLAGAVEKTILPSATVGWAKFGVAA